MPDPLDGDLAILRGAVNAVSAADASAAIRGWREFGMKRSAFRMVPFLKLWPRMARRPRLLVPGAAYHVMSRGNRKDPIFEDDEDRHRFLAIVSEETRRFDVTCYAFCLMGNHYHLAVATPEGNLSAAMRQVNGRYAKASNRRHGRTGHLFEGRFQSLVVESEAYLRDLARYVVLNPVRAGLVCDPSAWPWSSYRATVGLEDAPSFLDTSWIRWIFGGATQREARVRYGLYVNDKRTEITDVDVERLTLGTLPFDRVLRHDLAAKRFDKHIPRAHRALGRPPLNELFGVPGQTRRERNRLIHDAHVRHGYTLREIASFLGLHASTPSAIVRRLEAMSADR